MRYYPKYMHITAENTCVYPTLHAFLVRVRGGMDALHQLLNTIYVRDQTAIVPQVRFREPVCGALI
jgi:hypothetical protein